MELEADIATLLSAWEADWTVAWGSDPAQPAIRVLLVEDDKDDYRFTRDLLGEIGKRR